MVAFLHQFMQSSPENICNSHLLTFWLTFNTIDIRKNGGGCINLRTSAFD